MRFGRWDEILAAPEPDPALPARPGPAPLRPGRRLRGSGPARRGPRRAGAIPGGPSAGPRGGHLRQQQGGRPARRRRAVPDRRDPLPRRPPRGGVRRTPRGRPSPGPTPLFRAPGLDPAGPARPGRGLDAVGSVRGGRAGLSRGPRAAARERLVALRPGTFPRTPGSGDRGAAGPRPLGNDLAGCRHHALVVVFLPAGDVNGGEGHARGAVPLRRFKLGSGIEQHFRMSRRRCVLLGRARSTCINSPLGTIRPNCAEFFRSKRTILAQPGFRGGDFPEFLPGI